MQKSPFLSSQLSYFSSKFSSVACCSSVFIATLVLYNSLSDKLHTSPINVQIQLERHWNNKLNDFKAYKETRTMSLMSFWCFYFENIQNIDPLSANPSKLSNTLKQFVGKLPKNCLSVFDHFVGLALKGFTILTRKNCRNIN